MNNIEECRIMLVDDEIQLLYMIKEILYNEGFMHIYIQHHHAEKQLKSIKRKVQIL